MEKRKIALTEQIKNCGRPPCGFDEIFEPHSISSQAPVTVASDRLEDRRAVLKFVLAERLAYHPKDGFRTAETTLPLKALAVVKMGKIEMARLDGATSNELFEVLAGWTVHLEQHGTTDAQLKSPRGPQP